MCLAQPGLNVMNGGLYCQNAELWGCMEWMYISTLFVLLFIKSCIKKYEYYAGPSFGQDRNPC